MIGSKAWNSYGWREKYIFRPSQLGRSLNPSSVEGFFPSLSAVGLTYDGDLCPEGIFGLSHANVVAMLLGLILYSLNLGFCLLSLSLCFFYLVFELLSFLQLFPQSCQLLLGISQLVIGLACQLSLVFILSLCTLQSRICTFSSVFLVSQFFLQLCIAPFSNI